MALLKTIPSFLFSHTVCQFHSTVPLYVTALAECTYSLRTLGLGSSPPSSSIPLSTFLLLFLSILIFFVFPIVFIYLSIFFSFYFIYMLILCLPVWNLVLASLSQAVVPHSITEPLHFSPSLPPPSHCINPTDWDHAY